MTEAKWSRIPGKHRARPGFTALELLIVLVIVAIIAGMMLPSFQRAATRQDVRNARDAFAFLGSAARQTAAERGRTTRLVLDPDAARGWVELTEPDGTIDTIQTVDFATQYGTSLETSPAVGLVTVCFTPKGFASQSCGSFADLPMEVEFARAGHSWTARIWGLGQVERL